MAEIHAPRMSADIDDDFVVFLIGMRINKPWKVHTWPPVFMAMPRVLKELSQRPESGFPGQTMVVTAGATSSSRPVFTS